METATKTITTVATTTITAATEETTAEIEASEVARVVDSEEAVAETKTSGKTQKTTQRKPLKNFLRSLRIIQFGLLKFLKIFYKNGKNESLKKENIG